jgi:hypothetical protein
LMHKDLQLFLIDPIVLNFLAFIIYIKL